MLTSPGFNNYQHFANLSLFLFAMLPVEYFKAYPRPHFTLSIIRHCAALIKIGFYFYKHYIIIKPNEKNDSNSLI